MINKIFRPKILNRKRIDKILSQIFEVPIFFVSASMGYGKTTSVKNFLEKKKDVQVIWFDTSNEENDDIWMWYKLCSSIKNMNFNLGQKLTEYGMPQRNIDFYRIINTIRDEIKQKTVMVIDDWYDIKIFYINYLIKVIALEQMVNLHIVIISRNKPGNQYLELELKQKCLVMRQEDIAYTPDETMKFFEINGITLTEKEKRDVYDYTGGWTAATYLALLQYYNKNTFNNIPKATELIKIALYDKFDETTKEILLKLALVESFTLEQAIYITGNTKCNLVIENLISNNCFIKYDRKSMLYTLHSILKNVLEEEVSSSNVDINEINNACGDWYYKNNEDMNAIEYYYKGKNFQRVLDLIERNYTVDLTNLRQRIINSVFDQLSIEEKINRPIAYLTYIFFYILYGNPIVGANLLYEAKSIYEADENLEDKNQVLGEIAFLESLLMISDVKKMTEYHKKAYIYFDGGTSKIANYRMPVTLGSPHFLCLYHREKGQLKELIESFEGLKYFVHISSGGASGADYLMKAEYLFETGDLENGELFAYKALNKAKLKKQTSIIICSLFLLIRICVNNNNKSKVRDTLNILIKEYENFNNPLFSNGVEITLGYINGITGNLEEMPRWITDSEKNNLPGILPVSTMNYIVVGLAMILEGNYIKLEIHVETMIEADNLKNRIFGMIYAYIFESIAKYNLNNMEQAKKSLLKAIDVAKDDHIIMCFVEFAPHILPVLEDIKKENEYVKMLLPKCQEFNEIYEKNYGETKGVELTPRELEVMKLVDKGYKQSEISEKLNIALITVKKHIAAVYYKLNVKNKTIAINKLKEKGKI